MDRRNRQHINLENSTLNVRNPAFVAPLELRESYVIAMEAVGQTALDIQFAFAQEFRTVGVLAADSEKQLTLPELHPATTRIRPKIRRRT